MFGIRIVYAKEFCGKFAKYKELLIEGEENVGEFL
jgi:hypothetical protein